MRGGLFWLWGGFSVLQCSVGGLSCSHSRAFSNKSLWVDGIGGFDSLGLSLGWTVGGFAKKFVSLWVTCGLKWVVGPWIRAVAMLAVGF